MCQKNLILLLSLFCISALFTSKAKANDLPPLASFVDDVNRGFFFAGETVTFDGSGSIDQDEGGSSITRYRWTVDGVTLPESTSPTLSTSFNLTSGQNVKTVQITLEVRDDELTWSRNEEKMTKTYTVRRGQDRHFYLKDHLGSVRVTVDEAGEPIGFDDYYPYGLQMPTRSSNLSNPNDAYKYTGQERDTEAGLTFDYMGARTYDPMLGTFMQIDPLMEFATPYSYVGGNPINATDPTGMSSCKDNNGDPVLFSAAEGDPCDPSSGSITKQEEEQSEKEDQEEFIIIYGVRVSTSLLVKYTGNGTGSHQNRQRYFFQYMLELFGSDLDEAYGEGRFKNTSVSFVFGKFTDSKGKTYNTAGLTTFGKKGTPYEDFYVGDKDVTPDFGVEELEIVVYINPENSEGLSKNTAFHELRHVLMTTMLINESMVVKKGQHFIYNFYNKGENREFETDVNALRNYFENIND